MPADKEKTSRGSGATLAVALSLVILLPLLYFLSMGPVVWYYQSVPDPPWVGVVYRPIIMLSEAWPAFDSFVQAYLGMWSD